MAGPHLTRRGMMAVAAATSLAPRLALAAPAAGRAQPAALRVEWRRRPLGIDTLRPRFRWNLAASPVERGVHQTAWRIVVASSEVAAAGGRGDVWDSGKIASGRSAGRPSRDLALSDQTPFWWSLILWDEAGLASAWSAPERFVTGVIREWRGKWIAAEPGWPVQVAQSRTSRSVPGPRQMPLFRRGFVVAKPVRCATLSICGLGHHAVTINGREAHASMLDPGWTDYRQTVLYSTYDVTGLLALGQNAIGVMLGNGMYHVDGVKDRYKKFVGTFGQPRLIAQIAIIYADGSDDVIASDDRWSTRPGPIMFSSIYGGEDFDAQREVPGWDRPDGVHDGWSPVLLVDGPSGRLRAQGIPPITVGETFPVARVTEPKPGVFLYDFGENCASRPVLTVRGAAGAEVVLSPSETLGADGLIAPRSIGARPGLPVYYRYTLRGGGDETWRPRFSYCGSRYLQVTGAVPADRAKRGDVAVVALASEFVHTELPLVGTFDAGEKLLVQTHDLIRRAVLSNTASVFTDCPHREKLGWLEQDHLNAETVLYLEDAATMYEKLTADIVDAQLPNGQIPEIAPEFVIFGGADEVYRDSPEWGGAVVIAPWKAYRFHGDPRVLEIGYPAMRRYAAHIESKRTAAGLVDYGLGDWLDLAPPEPAQRRQLTSMGVTATATYYQMLTCLVDIARRLGRPMAEVVDYARRAAGVKTAFNAAFFRPDQGCYDTNSQTANAMPLALGMVPAGLEARVLDALVADINSRGDHVSAGDVGFHYVVRALSEHGRPDVLHAMLSRTDPPSYGAQIVAGATALTENWDPSRGGSQNHFMLGHALAWLYSGLGGIRLDFWRDDAPPITVAPQLVPGLDRVAVGYDSVLGPIRSAWSRGGGITRFEIDVPAGAAATLKLPVARAGLREGGAPVLRSAGITAAVEQGGQTVLTLGSGRYRFDAR